MKKIGLAVLGGLAATISNGAAEDVYRSENIIVAYVDDTSTISQTLMAGLRSDDGKAVLTLTCSADKNLMGGVMINGADPADLGNAVKLESGDKALSLTGRGLNVQRQLSFGAALPGSVFFSDIDNARMVRPANMRFINFVYRNYPLIVSFPNGTGTGDYTFEMAEFHPWMDRVAGECGRALEVAQ